MRLFRLVFPALLLGTAGCRSHNIEATVSNRTSEPIKLIEVDYPSASFGTQILAPGSDFHYRFQVIGQGKTRLTYTDSTNHEHKSEGPELTEGVEGSLTIIIASDGPRWQASPTISRP